MDDLISKEAVKKEIMTSWSIWNDKNFILRRIDLIPVIDAMPVMHGHWKDNGNGTVSCNCCATWFPKIRESQLLFCGYCGAKMDE